jgi:hypothetical protein
MPEGENGKANNKWALRIDIALNDKFTCKYGLYLN